MSRADRKSMAKLCEQAERYEDMVDHMRTLIKAHSKVDDPLDEEERNLLSVAYKNVVGSKRSAWRVLNAKVGEELTERQRKCAEDMKRRVEEELNKHCYEVVELLNDALIPHPEDVRAKVFFLKMKGDYHRYMVEIAGESTRNELTSKAGNAYQEAFELAKEKLPATSPIRLGLALNYSVFFYEIEGSSEKACQLAKDAFDDAIKDLDSLPEDVYKDSTLIMQLLRDNLTLWTSEQDEEQDQTEDE